MFNDVRIVANYDEENFKDEVRTDLAFLQHLTDGEETHFAAVKFMGLMDKFAKSCVAKRQLAKFDMRLEESSKRTVSNGNHVLCCVVLCCGVLAPFISLTPSSLP